LVDTYGNVLEVVTIQFGCDAEVVKGLTRRPGMYVNEESRSNGSDEVFVDRWDRGQLQNGADV